jgi:DNA-directed RNA polymerase, mitochondrial
VIKLNPVIAERLAKDAPGIHPRHLPMLTKPRPWVGVDQGGYIYNKTNVMRFKESREQERYLRRADQMGNLELVYAGLDVLGATAWKINRDVFDTVLKVWNSGERLGKIPPAVYDATEPVAPEPGADPAIRKAYLMKQKQWIQSKAANHSDRCSVNYKIEIARSVCVRHMPSLAVADRHFVRHLVHRRHVLPSSQP